MKKRNRNFLLAIARALDQAAQRIRRYVRTHTPRAARRALDELLGASNADH